MFTRKDYWTLFSFGMVNFNLIAQNEKKSCHQLLSPDVRRGARSNTGEASKRADSKKLGHPSFTRKGSE